MTPEATPRHGSSRSPYPTHDPARCSCSPPILRVSAAEGRHLALFESATDVDDTVATWKDVGTAGSSPMPAYTTLFGVEGVKLDEEPPLTSTWVAHWRHLITVGR